MIYQVSKQEIIDSNQLIKIYFFQIEFQTVLVFSENRSDYNTRVSLSNIALITNDFIFCTCARDQKIKIE